ncbi:MAG: hypothetical protein ACRDQW_13885 [Haloechinothrix sp.]
MAGSPPLAIAEASNGETVEVDGTGVMDAGDETASGGGTFIHRAADGSVVAEGTWTAHGLISFQFYGCSDQIMPGVTLCGGLAKLEITATRLGRRAAPGDVVDRLPDWREDSVGWGTGTA